MLYNADCYTDWYTVTPSTCVTAGVERRDCIYGDTTEYQERALALAEHTMGEWKTLVSPTIIKDGVQIRYCTVDGCDCSETQAIPATGLSSLLNQISSFLQTIVEMFRSIGDTLRTMFS